MALLAVSIHFPVVTLIAVRGGDTQHLSGRTHFVRQMAAFAFQTLSNYMLLVTEGAAESDSGLTFDPLMAEHTRRLKRSFRPRQAQLRVACLTTGLIEEFMGLGQESKGVTNIVNSPPLFNQFQVVASVHERLRFLAGE